MAAMPISPSLPLMRWSTERYLALVESGILEEGRGVELIDGQVVQEMPQGELHAWIFLALQRVFAAHGAYSSGFTTSPTLVLRNDNVFDPEFALLSVEAAHRFGLPRAPDVRIVIEIAVSSRDKDLGPKKLAYAQSEVSHYWVVDALDRGVWTFSKPVAGEYQETFFASAPSRLAVPGLDFDLDLAAIFPPKGE